MKFWPPPLELCPQWLHIVWLMRATSHNRAPGDHQFIFMLHVFLSICGHNFTCLHLLSSSKYYNNGHNFPLVTFSGFHTSDTFVVGLVTFSTIVICLVANTWHGGLHWHWHWHWHWLRIPDMVVCIRRPASRCQTQSRFCQRWNISICSTNGARWDTGV